MQFDGGGLEIRDRAPEIGEHTDEVFARGRRRRRGDRTAARARARWCEVAGPEAADDLGRRVELPRPRGRDRPAAAGVPALFVKSPRAVIAHEEPIVVPPARHRARLRRRARGRDRTTLSRRRRATTRSTWSRASRSRTTSRPAITSTSPVSSRGRSRSTRSARSVRKSCRSTRSTSLPCSRSRPKLNGEVMQSSTTADLVFAVPQLIAWITQGCTLDAGDVILTGTPSGVGAAQVPPRWLQDGDVVEITIEASARCATAVRRSRLRVGVRTLGAGTRTTRRRYRRNPNGTTPPTLHRQARRLARDLGLDLTRPRGVLDFQAAVRRRARSTAMSSRPTATLSGLRRDACESRIRCRCSASKPT